MLYTACPLQYATCVRVRFGMHNVYKLAHPHHGSARRHKIFLYRGGETHGKYLYVCTRVRLLYTHRAPQITRSNIPVIGRSATIFIDFPTTTLLSFRPRRVASTRDPPRKK